MISCLGRRTCICQLFWCEENRVFTHITTNMYKHDLCVIFQCWSTNSQRYINMFMFVCLFRHDIQQLTISILVYIHTYLRTYVPKYMRTYLHMYICIHTHITIHNVLTYMRTCVLAYMRTCIHAFMHTYIHIHIHIITYTIVSWLVLVAKRLVTLVKCNEYMISTWSYS